MFVIIRVQASTITLAANNIFSNDTMLVQMVLNRYYTCLGSLYSASTNRNNSFHCYNAQGAKASTIILAANSIFCNDTTIVQMVLNRDCTCFGTLGPATTKRDNSFCCCDARRAKTSTIMAAAHFKQ
jgi:hypothetical protein